MKSKLSRPILKITIDESDIIADAFAIFKDNKFEAFCPLRVNFIGQPAVDSGGPSYWEYDCLLHIVQWAVEFPFLSPAGLLLVPSD